MSDIALLAIFLEDKERDDLLVGPILIEGDYHFAIGDENRLNISLIFLSESFLTKISWNRLKIPHINNALAAFPVIEFHITLSLQKAAWRYNITAPKNNKARAIIQ
ncbi:MAG: hypothetical protein K5850_02045 [Bacteroidales bacterium]|nr:hypothetical protein [Bacteroidales bacterium]